MSAQPPTVPPSPPMLWDVFCRVVDNFGDIGVCWRLCSNLAARGQRLRLWVDEPGALAWMAPGALEGQTPGVQLLRWTDPLPDDLLSTLPASNVWVEAFGTDPPPEFVRAMAARVAEGEPPPIWINLEYLSAETYVERSHGLPSPVTSGAARGWTKWFYYPGFTLATGGLLREPGTLERRAAFSPQPWLSQTGLEAADPPRPRVSLFCYEPPALPAVLEQVGQDVTHSDWLVTPGRAAQAVAHAIEAGAPGPACHLHALPALSQVDYDHLLWSCDLNLVRGEDSLVRALWAGEPFVWHIYPQTDNAHQAKLEAFLDWLDPPDSLRQFHQAWNGLAHSDTPWPGWDVVHAWRPCVQRARDRLLAQDDLATQLLGFIAKKR